MVDLFVEECRRLRRKADRCADMHRRSHFLITPMAATPSVATERHPKRRTLMTRG
jgi:hypothetical protein